jgi:hypothetical protein
MIWLAAPFLLAVLASGGVTQTVDAAPYVLQVTVAGDPVQAGDAASFRVIVEGDVKSARLEARALPARGTPATPVRAQVSGGPEAGAFTGTVSLPVRGDWMLVLSATGPAGSGSVQIPLRASSPVVLPTWLGWLIGLSPLVGLIGFGIAQRRQLRLRHCP